jgi:hypothetical protein
MAQKKYSKSGMRRLRAHVKTKLRRLNRALDIIAFEQDVLNEQAKPFGGILLLMERRNIPAHSEEAAIRERSVALINRGQRLATEQSRLGLLLEKLQERLND